MSHVFAPRLHHLAAFVLVYVWWRLRLEPTAFHQHAALPKLVAPLQNLAQARKRVGFTPP
jgi:hypothetical protein